MTIVQLIKKNLVFLRIMLTVLFRTKTQMFYQCGRAGIDNELMLAGHFQIPNVENNFFCPLVKDA